MRRTVAAVALVALVATAALAVGGGGGGSSPTTNRPTTSTDPTSTEPSSREAAAWDARVREAFGPFVAELPQLLESLRGWRQGTITSDELDRRLHQHLAAALDSQRRVAGLEPLPATPEALELYRASVALTVLSVQAHAAALALTGDLAAQVDVLGQRLRLLADRVFDRGYAVVEVMLPGPHLFGDQSGDVDLRLPEDVPRWPAEGLAPGPPLDVGAPAPPEGSAPPLREARRPVQGRSGWVATIGAVGPPSVGDVRAAVGEGDAGPLADLSRRLVVAAELLRAAPDPDAPGGREESARVRLGLLVLADAARAAQAAALSGGAGADELRSLAGRLVDVVAGSPLDLPQG